MSDRRQELAIQAANTYKGKVCCYANVTKRKFKEGSDPALKFSKTSDVGINIFDPDTQKGVKFFLGGTLPAFIFEKTKLCMAHAFNANLSDKNSGARNNSLAYTIKLKKGIFKDRTPAEILSTNPEKYNELITLYNELVANVSNPQYSKYRKINEDQAKAINEACSLYANKQLIATSAYPKINIWDGMRTPDNTKLDENGNTEVRIAKLTFDTDPNNKEPYTIEITNCMAPPVQNSLVGAKLSQATNSVVLSMNFTEEIWFGFWKDVLDAKDAFARLMESDRIVYSENNMWKPQLQNTTVNQQYPNNMQQAYSQYPNQYPYPYPNGIAN